MAKGKSYKKSKSNSNRGDETKRAQPKESKVQSRICLQSIQPEQMSLTAHRHIKEIMNGKTYMDEDDVTAVLRLTQHLRVFGLLSAAGFTKHTNEQDGRVRDRMPPVWTSLLRELIIENNSSTEFFLVETILNMAEKKPVEYMMLWRRSLIFANHWSFWAKAYKQPKMSPEEKQEVTLSGYTINPL
jgi:hypothetical protein